MSRVWWTFPWTIALQQVLLYIDHLIRCIRIQRNDQSLLHSIPIQGGLLWVCSSLWSNCALINLIILPLASLSLFIIAHSRIRGQINSSCSMAVDQHDRKHYCSLDASTIGWIIMRLTKFSICWIKVLQRADLTGQGQLESIDEWLPEQHNPAMKWEYSQLTEYEDPCCAWNRSLACVTRCCVLYGLKIFNLSTESRILKLPSDQCSCNKKINLDRGYTNNLVQKLSCLFI